MSLPTEDKHFKEEEEKRKKSEAVGRIHDCEEADCQIRQDGTRRRRPRPGEADAAPSVSMPVE